jgi:hypothetical protein
MQVKILQFTNGYLNECNLFVYEKQTIKKAGLELSFLKQEILQLQFTILLHLEIVV